MFRIANYDSYFSFFLSLSINRIREESEVIHSISVQPEITSFWWLHTYILGNSPVYFIRVKENLFKVQFE